MSSCGDSFDWFDHDGNNPPQTGWWFTCERHSALTGKYDPDYGTPLLDRDREVVSVQEAK